MVLPSKGMTTKIARGSLKKLLYLGISASKVNLKSNIEVKTSHSLPRHLKNSSKNTRKKTINQMNYNSKKVQLFRTSVVNLGIVSVHSKIQSRTNLILYSTSKYLDLSLELYLL